MKLKMEAILNAVVSVLLGNQQFFVESQKIIFQCFNSVLISYRTSDVIGIRLD
jgi:hypothetical protein